MNGRRVAAAVAVVVAAGTGCTVAAEPLTYATGCETVTVDGVVLGNLRGAGVRVEFRPDGARGAVVVAGQYVGHADRDGARFAACAAGSVLAAIGEAQP